MLPIFVVVLLAVVSLLLIFSVELLCVSMVTRRYTKYEEIYTLKMVNR